MPFYTKCICYLKHSYTTYAFKLRKMNLYGIYD